MTLSHLRDFLNQRVRDGVLRRSVDKWSKAGVLEGGNLLHPDTGTPQGGVVSPLPANIYLHEVLDVWFEAVVKPRLRGRAFMVRYADDAVLVFSNESDARRVLDVLPKRFGKYGLALHPTKTRLLRFGPPGPEPDRTDGPGSFDFLGLRHHWGRSQRGPWMVQRKTAGDRFGRTRRRLARFMRIHRHAEVAWQHLKPTQALRGHYAYFGVSGNSKALRCMHYEVARDWWKRLRRRGQRVRLTWDRFKLLLARYPLPEPCIRSAWVRHLAANPST